MSGSPIDDDAYHAADEDERFERRASPIPEGGEGEREKEKALDIAKRIHEADAYALTEWLDKCAISDIELLARALLSSPRVERERALRDAIFAVDKALENGSPRETWTSAEIAMDEDREAAIEAIRTLSTG